MHVCLAGRQPPAWPVFCSLNAALRAALPALLGWALALAVVPAGAQSSTLRVEIDLREAMADGRFDPAHDRVGLRGGMAPLSWSRTLHAAPVARQPGRFALTVGWPATPAQPVPYKFKIDRAGVPHDGWEAGRNHTVAVVPGRQTLARAFGSAPGEPPPPQRTGHIERIAPQPSSHVAPREVQVWLPPGYDAEPGRRYPVLYLHDGENVFDATAAGAEWQVDETAQREVQRGQVAPLIVVAVAGGGTRIHDYAPVPGHGPEGPAGGGASAYGRYLVRELKPLIDARYRTLRGREHTAVGGSSLGGLVSMGLLLEQAGTFGAGLVVSPAVHWGDREILRTVAQAELPQTPPRVWLDVGSLEGRDAVDGARALRAALAARGWPVAYREQAGAGHDEAAWAARVAPMLRFLHGTPAPAAR